VDDEFHLVAKGDAPLANASDKKQQQQSTSHQHAKRALCVAGAVAAAAVGFNILPTAGKALFAGEQGAWRHLMTRDWSDEKTWQAGTYKTHFLGGFLGTGAIEVAKQVQTGGANWWYHERKRLG